MVDRLCDQRLGDKEFNKRVAENINKYWAKIGYDARAKVKKLPVSANNQEGGVFYQVEFEHNRFGCPIRKVR